MEVSGVTVILLFSWSMCTAHQAITKSTFCSCSISYALHNKNVHIFPPATLTMMTPHQSMLTLVLTVIVLALPSTGTILTVQPNSTTPCDNEPCFTLSEYVQNRSKYFNTSNITLQFLPGDHTLDSNLIIADIQHLNILGNGSSPTPSRVECTGSNVGFEFRKISEVRVRDMTFTLCGRSHTTYYFEYRYFLSYAVRFESVRHIEVIDCDFHDNYGSALGIFNSRVSFSGNNTFSSNCRRRYSGCFGGGIYVEASEANFSGIATFDGNSGSDGGGIHAWNNSVVIFSGSTSFKENSATFGGGIRARYNSDVSFSGNTSFKENSAVIGGGIHARDNSDVSFSGNTSFKENSAGLGGGIYAWDNSDVSFSGSTSFRENSARDSGGGICAFDNSDVSFSGSTSFRENSASFGGGGGIYAHGNSDVSFSGSTSFRENSARDSGGGIYARNNSDVSFSGTGTISDNIARDGGGFWSKISTIELSGNITVRNNTAQQYGGGIYMNTFDQKATVIGGGIYMKTTNLKLTGTNKFTDNSAREGGGIYAVKNSNLEFDGMNIFDTNKATDSGGGIYMEKTNLSLAGTNNFTDNSARDGGGIYAAENSNLDFDGMNTFDTNRAGIRGGGIWMDNGNLIFNGNNSVVRCTAGIDGGGIGIYNVTINLQGNIKFISNLARRGGGISARRSTFSFTNSSHFSNNSATDTGGGISTSISTLTFSGINTFENNSADLGGGIYMLNSSFHFLGKNNFILNHARRDGGGIYGRGDGTVNMSGSNSFHDNKAERGGGIFLESCNFTTWRRNCSTNCNSKVTVQTNIFERNTAENDGGGICIIKGILNLSGSNNFYDNEAEMGGAMFIEDGRLWLSGSSLFHKNKGTTGGGLYSFKSVFEVSGMYNFTANSVLNAGGGFAAVYSTLYLSGKTNFQSNSALSGGAMYMEDTQVNLNGTNHFIHDSAHYEGGAVYMRGGKINISGRNVFEHNSAAMRGGSFFATCVVINITGIITVCNSTSPEGAGVHVVSSSIIFEGKTQFQNNWAQYGGTVFLENSNFIFDPESGSSFINNTALHGGAMHLDHRSRMYIHPLACMLFENNTAKEYGGAIYVIDVIGTHTCPPSLVLPSRNECFAHMISNELSETGRINLTFQGNTAGESGSVLYGGMLNKCNNSYYALHLFNSSIKDETKVAAISSDPVLCFCTEGGPHDRECDEEKRIDAFPGQKVNVSVIAVDQTDTPIQTAIHTGLISDEKHNSRVCEAFSQEKEGLCTNRSYTITSPNTTSKLLLYPTAVSGSSTPAVLNTTFQNCPIGFEKSNSTNECICDHRLQIFNITCNIDSQTLLRTGEMSFWVNASYDNGSFNGYITHPQCPLNYCTKESKHINMNNPDEQCDSNHSGLLCGSCKENFSFILGGSQCRKCSNEYLALLIPFALAGVALVILLFVLNMTVTTGTLHGLIFYANIVAANHQIFFPLDTNIVARIFIAWLNLDLGIETCFYHGMDAYCKLWLQFVFPLYIWGIVGFLIYISRRSPRLTRLLGTHPVPVLDTLFLLSYTKLLRTIITALSLTTLQYPNSDSRVVWLYDPSVPFHKLIPFVLVALIFLVLFLFPYTLLLLLGQWLETRTKCRPLSCWNKYPRLKLRLKTILDPYHAPYNSECRYWTGLFLLLRCFLFLVSAFNVSGDKNSANLLAILIIVIVSFVVFGLSGRVYKSWCLNALEVSFLLNLGVFTAGTYHVSLTAGNQAAITYTSVGVAFTTFVGIVAYHAYLRLKPWQLQCTIYCNKNEDDKTNINEENDTIQNNQLQTRPQAAPVTTIVDLRELRSPLNLITN